MPKQCSPTLLKPGSLLRISYLPLSLLSWPHFGYFPVLEPSEGASLLPPQSHTWEGQVHAELLTPSAPQSAVPSWDLWRSEVLHPSSCSALCAWDSQQSNQCSGLTSSYGHNCCSFWPHFHAHMDCNPDWTGSGGQMSSSPIPLHLEVSCLRFLPLSRKREVLIHVNQINGWPTVSSAHQFCIWKTCASVLSLLGHCVLCAL